MRVGIGFDAHSFGGNRPLRLGGVAVPHEMGLEGHSDGDVLLHAIADSILGAAALPSLGEFFPDTDPALAGADSAQLLARVRKRALEAGFSIENVDAVLVAEAPRIAPYRREMVSRIAQILGISTARVNVHATSSNRLGFAGRGEGVAAFAVALLTPLRQAAGGRRKAKPSRAAQRRRRAS